ncbi:MAG: citrate synthase, partial [Frankiales bacterium]|nr:citrate synthase [Frankiales bacterium]
MTDTTITADAAAPTTDTAAAVEAAPTGATFTFGEHSLDLKVVPASEGAPGVEIGKLLSTAGVITLDPGFTNTG